MSTNGMSAKRFATLIGLTTLLWLSGCARPPSIAPETAVPCSAVTTSPHTLRDVDHLSPPLLRWLERTNVAIETGCGRVR